MLRDEHELLRRGRSCRRRPSSKSCERPSFPSASTSATRSMRGQPTTCTPARAPSPMAHDPVSGVDAAGKWHVPRTWSPHGGSTRRCFRTPRHPSCGRAEMFMYVARGGRHGLEWSPTVITTSGLSRRTRWAARAARGRSTRLVPGVSPSIRHEHALVGGEAVFLDQVEHGAVAVRAAPKPPRRAAA